MEEMQFIVPVQYLQTRLGLQIYASHVQIDALRSFSWPATPLCDGLISLHLRFHFPFPTIN